MPLGPSRTDHGYPRGKVVNGVAVSTRAPKAPSRNKQRHSQGGRQPAGQRGRDGVPEHAARVRPRQRPCSCGSPRGRAAQQRPASARCRRPAAGRDARAQALDGAGGCRRPRKRREPRSPRFRSSRGRARASNRPIGPAALNQMPIAQMTPAATRPRPRPSRRCSGSRSRAVAARAPTIRARPPTIRARDRQSAGDRPPEQHDRVAAVPRRRDTANGSRTGGYGRLAGDCGWQ